MRAGKLRQVVTIQQRAPVSNSYNEPGDTWATYTTRRAQVMPLVGREYFAGEGRKAEVTTRFRFRYVEGLVPSMRLIWLGRVFDISDVQMVDGLKAEMVVMAKELVGLPA